MLGTGKHNMLAVQHASDDRISAANDEAPQFLGSRLESWVRPIRRISLVVAILIRRKRYLIRYEVLVAFNIFDELA